MVIINVEKNEILLIGIKLLKNNKIRKVHFNRNMLRIQLSGIIIWGYLTLIIKKNGRK